MLLLLALACSNDCTADKACPFDGSEYFVLEADEPTGRAIIYLHGAGTDGEGVQNRQKEQKFLQGGWSMIYPNAPSGFWQVSRGVDGAAQDAAWVADLSDKLREDGVADEFVVGGHSVGGSMTWYTACFEGDRFLGFIPSSGGFWVPEPTACDVGQVSLRHSHGRDDTFVPMEGRELGNGGGIAQGNIFNGLDMWRDHNDCSDEVEVTEEGPYTCEANVGCDGALQVCLYDGKHGTPPNWEPEALAWINGL